MIDKLLTFTRHPRTPKESAAIIFVVLDDFGSSQYAFALSDVSKDVNSPNAVKVYIICLYQYKTIIVYQNVSLHFMIFYFYLFIRCGSIKYVKHV